MDIWGLRFMDICGFPKISGAILGGSRNADHGVSLGVPYSWETNKKEG